MASRASSTAYVLSGQFCSRWQAAPTPDSPAPTTRTSTCSWAIAHKYRGLEQRVVEEADHTSLVLLGSGVEAAGVLRLRDLPKCLRLVRGGVELAVELLAVLRVRCGDEQDGARGDAPDERLQVGRRRLVREDAERADPPGDAGRVQELLDAPDALDVHPVQLVAQRPRAGALGDHRPQVVGLGGRLEHHLAADRQADPADAAGVDV